MPSAEANQRLVERAAGEAVSRRRPIETRGICSERHGGTECVLALGCGERANGLRQCVERSQKGPYSLRFTCGSTKRMKFVRGLDDCGRDVRGPLDPAESVRADSVCLSD